MATKKAPATKDNFLWDVLAAADTNCKSAWDEFTEEERKKVTFFTLNRWLSCITGKPTAVEDQLLITNELYNKHLFSIMKHHPKLVWLTACTSNYNGTKQSHQWIKVEKITSKKEKALAELFPLMKMDDIKTLATVTSDNDIKEHCESLGWTKKAINNLAL